MVDPADVPLPPDTEELADGETSAEKGPVAKTNEVDSGCPAETDTGSATSGAIIRESPPAPETQANNQAVSQSVPPHVRPPLMSVEPRPSAQRDQQTSQACDLCEFNCLEDIAYLVELQHRASGPFPPRAPRQHGAFNRESPYNRPNDTEEMARSYATTLKYERQLNEERMAKQKAYKYIESELQERMTTAVNSMLAEVLKKEMNIVKQRVALETKEKELSRRETHIRQLETFLALGQQQLHYDLSQRGVEVLDEGELQYEYVRGKTAGYNEYENHSGQVSTRMEQLSIRESVLDVNERTYKSIIREGLEKELRVTVAGEISASIEKVQFDKGFVAGREAGYKSIDKETYQQGYNDGYATSHRHRDALSNLQSGRIPHNHPSLDYLYNPAHPENPFLRESAQQNRQQDAGNNERHEREMPQLRVATRSVIAPPVRKPLCAEFNLAPPLHCGQPVVNGVRTVVGRPPLMRLDQHDSEETVRPEEGEEKSNGEVEDPNLIDL